MEVVLDLLMKEEILAQVLLEVLKDILNLVLLPCRAVAEEGLLEPVSPEEVVYLGTQLKEAAQLGIIKEETEDLHTEPIYLEQPNGMAAEEAEALKV